MAIKISNNFVDNII